MCMYIYVYFTFYHIYFYYLLFIFYYILLYMIFSGNISLTHLTHMVSMGEQWSLNGYNRMKQPFLINFELGPILFACVELLDCGYWVVGNLLLLLGISEIFLGLAGTVGDCRMSLSLRKASFVHVDFVRKWQKEHFIAD